jgi:hypothetical protein
VLHICPNWPDEQGSIIGVETCAQSDRVGSYGVEQANLGCHVPEFLKWVFCQYEQQ